MAPLLTADCTNSEMYRQPLSGTISWLQCQECEHIFTDGYYTEEALAVVFKGVADNQKPGKNVENNRLISARMIEKVLPFKNSGVWIDVGFGNGSLLMTADEFGFDAVGLDLRESTVIGMKLLGFEVYQRDLTGFDGDRPVAVVSMADVLEHTPFPKEVLRAAHRLLEPGGALFLSMPNADSPIWKMATRQNANPYWGELEHYHNFGRARLYRLLEEVGFNVRRYGISQRYRMCMEVVATRA